MSRLYDGTAGVSATSFAPATTYPFTMAVWFKQTTPSDATVRHIHAIGTTGSNNNRYTIYVGGDGTVGINARTTADQTVTTAASYADTNWHLAVAVFTSATDRKLYVDTLGSVVSDTVSSAPSATNRMRIGGNFTTPSNFFNGYVAQPAVWNVALNADEVGMLLNRVPATRVRRNSLVFYAPFFGRETNDINIMGATNIPLVAGSAPDDGSEPPVSRGVGERHLYIVSSATAGVPQFDIAPSVQSQTASAYTLEATPNQSATWYTAVVPAGTAVPSKAQIKAGTGGGIIAAANKAVTGADTLTVGGSLTFPLHDIHSLLSNVGGDGNIASLFAEYLDPPTGKQFMVFDVPLSATAVESLVNASPAIADGDVWVIDLVTDPGDYAVFVSDDGELDVNVMGDTGRQIIVHNVYDLSLQQYYGQGNIVINNQSPIVISNPAEIQVFKLAKNTAMTPYDLRVHFSDPEDDTLTVTAVDSLAAYGLQITTSQLNGTTVNSDVIATGLTVRCTDQYGASVDADMTLVIGNVTVPDVVGLNSSVAVDTLTAGYLQGLVIASIPSTEPAGEVLIQSPPASSSVAPDTIVNLTISNGAFPSAPVNLRINATNRRRRRGGYWTQT